MKSSLKCPRQLKKDDDNLTLHFEINSGELIVIKGDRKISLSQPEIKAILESAEFRILNEPARKTPFSNLMAEARVASGLSQLDVAREFGYTSMQFISNWERGKSLPPIQNLKAIAALYNLDADVLFDAYLNEVLYNVSTEMHARFSSSERSPQISGPRHRAKLAKTYKRKKKSDAQQAS